MVAPVFFSMWSFSGHCKFCVKKHVQMQQEELSEKLLPKAVRMVTGEMMTVAGQQCDTERAWSNGYQNAAWHLPAATDAAGCRPGRAKPPELWVMCWRPRTSFPVSPHQAPNKPARTVSTAGTLFCPSLWNSTSSMKQDSNQFGPLTPNPNMAFHCSPTLVFYYFRDWRAVLLIEKTRRETEDAPRSLPHAESEPFGLPVEQWTQGRGRGLRQTVPFMTKEFRPHSPPAFQEAWEKTAVVIAV